MSWRKGFCIQFATTLTPSQLASLPFTDITSSITTFTISDGSGLVINNTNAFSDRFSISTDTSGNIVAWLIESCVNGCNTQMQTNWNSPTSFQPGEDFSSTALNFSGSFGVISNNPGKWSMSQEPSGDLSAAPVPRFLGSMPCPIPIPSNVQAQASVTASGLLFNRVSQTFSGTVTVKNVTSKTFSGPLELAFHGLPSGASLVNGAVSPIFGPYVALTGSSLLPGQSVTVNVQFAAPAGTKITFTPQVYSGSLF